jgi:hypothetical protein
MTVGAEHFLPRLSPPVQAPLLGLPLLLATRRRLAVGPQIGLVREVVREVIADLVRLVVRLVVREIVHVIRLRGATGVRLAAKVILREGVERARVDDLGRVAAGQDVSRSGAMA